MEHILALLIEYKYFILFPLAAIEGPIVSLAAGFLIHTGHLSFIPTYLIFILGDVIPDCLYYYLGKFGDKKQILQKYISKDGFVSRNLNHPLENLLNIPLFFRSFNMEQYSLQAIS